MYKGKNETDIKKDDVNEEKVWKPSAKGFKKAMETQGFRIGNYYHVSHGYLNPLFMLIWYCIVTEFPPEVWLLKAGYIEALFIQYADELGIYPPIWMTTLSDISIRASPYGANEYKRGRSKNGKKAGPLVGSFSTSISSRTSSHYSYQIGEVH